MMGIMVQRGRQLQSEQFAQLAQIGMTVDEISP